MLRPIVKNDSRVRRFLMILKILGVCFVAAWFFSSTLCRTVPVEYDALGTARRPLVIVNGQTQQLATGDYLSSVGGVTTNATAPAAGDIQTTTITSSGVATLGGVTKTGATKCVSACVITAAISSTQDNWNPTGLATASLVNITGSGTQTITGLAAQPTGTEIILRYASSSGTVSLTTGSTSSLTANQFDFLATITLQPYQSITLLYTGTNWVGIGWGGGGFGGIPNWTVSAILNAGEIRPGVLTYTTTGTSHDLGSSSAVIIRYTGTNTATWDGFLSGAVGRPLIVVNESAFDLTLANETGSSAGRQLANIGGVDIVLAGTPTTSGTGQTSSATYVYNGSYWKLTSYMSTKDALPKQFTSPKTKGAITLVAGTGTATVMSGSLCTCTDQTAATAPKCFVSGTTLTASTAASTTDVITYLCF